MEYQHPPPAPRVLHSEKASQLLLIAAAEHSGFISFTPLQSGLVAVGEGPQYGIRSHFGTFTSDQAGSILEGAGDARVVRTFEQEEDRVQDHS